MKNIKLIIYTGIRTHFYHSRMLNMSPVFSGKMLLKQWWHNQKD